MKFQKYENTKPSEIPWIGDIPEEWDVKPLFAYCKENQEKNTGGKNDNVLSLSYGNIIRRDVKDNFGLIPDSFDSYQILQPGTLVLRLTDLQNDKKSLRVGLAKEKGIITSAYVGLLSNPKIIPEYLYYLLHSYDISKVFYGMGGGVRQSLSFSEIKRLPLLDFPVEEQKQIVEFIIQETSQINFKISNHQKLIKLLIQKKKLILKHTVTKGLDTSVEVCDSKIPWIGEIPKHWKIYKLKFNNTKIIAGQSPNSNSYSKSEGIPFLQGCEGFTDVYTNPTIRTIEPTKIVPENTILISVRAPVGEINISNSEICIGRGLAGIQCLEHDVDFKFLYYYLTYAKEYISSLSRGTTYDSIRSEDVQNLLSLHFPYEEQKQISRFLDVQTAKLDSLILNLQDKIKKLQEFQKSLIFSSVSGKISIIP